MRELQKIISSPLMVQDVFELMSEAELDEFERRYEVMSKFNYKETMRFMQKRFGIDPGAPIGGRFGKYPAFAPYRESLGKGRADLRPVLPCSWCGRTPAVRQISPCEHVLCGACTKEAEAGLQDDSDEECDAINCGQVIEGLGEIEDGMLPDESVGNHETPMDTDNGGKEGGSSRKRVKRRVEKSRASWLELDGVPMPSTKLLFVKLKVWEWLWKEPNVKIIIFTHSLDV